MLSTFEYKHFQDSTEMHLHCSGIFNEHLIASESVRKFWKSVRFLKICVRFDVWRSCEVMNLGGLPFYEPPCTYNR